MFLADNLQIMKTSDNDHKALQTRINVVFGTALMVIGSLMAVFVFADRTGAEFIPMPDVWYDSREFHIVICVMVFAFAAILLKESPSGSVDEAAVDEPVFEDIRFYTRNNCSLCDQAWETLQRFEGISRAVTVVDIDTDPELRERFTDCVPVVEVDGRIRFRGMLDPDLLQRLIDGARCQPHGEPSDSVAGADREVCPGPVSRRQRDAP